VRFPCATRLIIVVKGTKTHAREVREGCQQFLENTLKLTLNMDKTHITHVNDGFIFLGHRIIRKKGPKGKMRIVTNIPWEKYRRFIEKLVKRLSGNYSMNPLDMIESLNRQISGWVNFYQYTDYTATIYKKIDHAVFWKFGHWLARKYKTSFPNLMQKYFHTHCEETAKTWVIRGKNSWSNQYKQVALKRLVSSRKGRFKWRNPTGNPYNPTIEEHRFYESYFDEVAFALSNT